MTKDSEHQRLCAVCGSRRKRFLFQQKFAGAPQGSLLSGYDVVICSDCGFGYADRLPNQCDFDVYYERMSKYEYEYRRGESDFDARRFPVAADFIRLSVPDPQSSILDVGCSNGGLLHALQQGGYTHVMGLDPSPVCAQMAERLYGIQVMSGSLFHLPSGLGCYDIVLLGAVLEHINNLASALSQTRRLLKKHGVLYIEVPDVSRFAHSADAPFQEFSVEHINYFSVASLKNLLNNAGFELIQTRQTSTTKGKNIVSPELKAMFRMVDKPSRQLFARDEETERALAAYIRNSRDVECRIHEAIAPWVANRKAIIVWGVGTHTQRLLATSALAQADIRAFVDSNPRYQGKHMNGVPILPPAALKGRLEPILISSRFYQTEIKQQISGEMGLKNELILLYDV